MSDQYCPPDNQQYYLNAPSTSGIGGAVSISSDFYNAPQTRCTRDTHYFACKHEEKCNCGRTERLPLEMDEGL